MRSARLCAVGLLLAALARPWAAAAQESNPEAPAIRLLESDEAERKRLSTEPPFASVEVARALLDLGQKAMLDAQFPRAVLAFRTAETIARAGGAEVEVGRAMNGAAFALYRHAQFEPAREAAEASVVLHERLGDAAGQADAWNTIGSVRRSRTADDSVLEAYQKALSLWTSVDDRRGMARATGNIGGVHQARGDLEEALSHQQQALQLFEEAGDLRGAANTLDNIGSVHLFRGERLEALEHSRKASRSASGPATDWASPVGWDRWATRTTGSVTSRALDFFNRNLKLSRPGPR